MHSFTPIWDGRRRDVEIGVLFDQYDDFAYQLVDDLCAVGRDARANEPYSGRTGELMYAATRHGTYHRTPYIEFEVRQDLLKDPEGIESMAQLLTAALTRRLPDILRT